MNFKQISLLLILIPLLGWMPVHGSPVNLVWNVNGISHTLIDDGMFLFQDTQIETDPLPGFTANLNQTDSIRLAFNAPAGERFVVTPKGVEPMRMQIMVNYHGESNVFGATFLPSMVVGFTGAQGTLPSQITEVGESLIRTNGNQVLFNFIYEFVEPFSFTGWSAEMEGPFTVSSGTYTYSVVDMYLGIRVPIETDLGPTIALEVIPEASTLGLLFFSLLVLRGLRGSSRRKL